MYCKNCGNEIKEDEKYCGKCGAESKIYNTTNNSENAINDKKIIKIKFNHIIIGIIAVFVVLIMISFGMTYINSKDGVTSTVISQSDTITSKNDENQPIYTGKKYISKNDKTSSYITFESNTSFKYVTNYIIMSGIYEIEGNTIKSKTISINGTSSTIMEDYTIIDKKTIKSQSSGVIYEISND